LGGKGYLYIHLAFVDGDSDTLIYVPFVNL